MIRVLIKKILNYFLNTTEKHQNVTFSGFSRGLKNVNFEGQNLVSDKCNFFGNITIGYATTLGFNNVLHGTINIGKYCQFGADVALHATNHPIQFLTTYINKNLFKGELKKNKINHKIKVGHDVWIGHGVIIVGNITIGNGAIIAAGSVVTKNVAPYSIVAGVPSKKIDKRFSDSIIKEIEELKWWDKSKNELEKIKPLFFKNLKNRVTIYD